MITSYYIIIFLYKISNQIQVNHWIKIYPYKKQIQLNVSTLFDNSIHFNSTTQFDFKYLKIDDSIQFNSTTQVNSTIQLNSETKASIAQLPYERCLPLFPNWMESSNWVNSVVRIEFNLQTALYRRIENLQIDINVYITISDILKQIQSCMVCRFLLHHRW